MTMWLTTLGYEAVAVAYAVFCAFVASRGSYSRIALFFMVALLATAGWAQLTVLALNDILPNWCSELAAIMRDGGWLAFGLALIYSRMGDVNYWRLTAASVFGLLALQIVFFYTSASLGTVAGVRIDAPLIRFTSTLLGLILMENVFRNASREEFWALKHWAIGFCAILVFQLAIRIPEFLTHTDDANVELANPLVFLVVLPLFFISSLRLLQLQLKIRSSRAFVFRTATLIAGGVILQGTAFAAWYVRSYGGSNGTALALTVAFSGIVGAAVLLASGTFRSRVRLLLNEHFFSLRYDYRFEWERAIRGLTAYPEKNIAERALRIMCDLLDTSGGAIWLHRESWRQFKLSGKLGVPVHVATLQDDDYRIELLRRNDRPFMDISRDAQGDQSFTVFQAFIDNGWIVLPLRYRSTLAGFIILNLPRVSRKLDWEDENLVRVLAMQVTSYLVQEEMAQSLADARQLEDFNKRFAFVVHDIKNTIGQLSLMVRNIAQFGDQKEFRNDMVITLGNSVERMQILLKSLTAVGTKSPVQGESDHVFDLTELLVNLAAEKSRLGYTVQLSNSPGVSLVNTDSVALSRVLEHVISNAFEASEPGTPVDIDVSAVGNAFEIVVTDRGAGMTRQFIEEELFRPLRSTKRGGFGVGGYQIRELMRDLGGDVEVESRVSVGTRVTLILPGNGQSTLS